MRNLAVIDFMEKNIASYFESNLKKTFKGFRITMEVMPENGYPLASLDMVKAEILELYCALIRHRIIAHSPKESEFFKKSIIFDDVYLLMKVADPFHLHLYPDELYLALNIT